MMMRYFTKLLMVAARPGIKVWQVAAVDRQAQTRLCELCATECANHADSSDSADPTTETG